MISCSSAFKTAFLSFGRMLDARITAGQTTYTGDDVVTVEPYFDAELFTACMRGTNVTLLATQPLDVESIGVEIGALTETGTEYLNFGTRYVRNQKVNVADKTVTLECYDAMIKAMVPYALTASDITFPCTVRTLLDAIRMKLGYAKGYPNSFTNSTRSIPSDPYKGLGMTYRDVLTEIAQLSGRTIFMSGNQLMMSDPVTTGYSVSVDDLVGYDIGGEYGPINSVDFLITPDDHAKASDAESIAENGLCEVTFSGNQLADTIGRETAAQHVLSHLMLASITYERFSVETYGLPWLDICDAFGITDEDGETHGCLMMSNQMELGSGCNGTASAIIPAVAKEEYDTSFGQQEREIAKKPSKTQLQEAIDHATEMITGNAGGHIVIKYAAGKPSELLIMDTESEITAQKIWRWNLNGLGFSDDSGQSYGLALTADGQIVADFITTGTLNAEDVNIINLKAENISVNNSYTVADELAELSDRIDGAKNHYEVTATPTLKNYPAWDFTYNIPCNGTVQLADDLKFLYTTEYYRKHSGDLAFNSRTGLAYRFAFDVDNGVYYWLDVADSDLGEILQRVYSLETTAEGLTSTATQLRSDLTEDESKITQNATGITALVSRASALETWKGTASSQITQTADGLSAVVTRVTGTEDRLDEAETTIEATADGLSSLVTRTGSLETWKGTASTQISQTATSLSAVSTRVTGTERRLTTAESQITANASAITTKVSSTDYTGSKVTSMINQSASSVKISAQHIDLEGAVTITALDSATRSKVNGSAASSVPVYYRDTTGTAPTITASTSIGNTVNTSNAWSYNMPRPLRGATYYMASRTTKSDGTIAVSAVRQMANETYTSKWAASQDATYIDGGAIYANSITASQIAAGAITVSKLADSIQDDINGAATGTLQLYYRTASSTAPTISASTSVISTFDADDQWSYNMLRPKKNAYFYTCTRTSKTDGAVSFSTVRQIANATYTSRWCSSSDATCIDGGAIYANSITANQIAAGAITADKIATGAISVSKLAQGIRDDINGSATASVSVYYRSTTNTTPSISSSTSIGTSQNTDNAWTYLMPRPKNGTYFYTCTRLTKTDGSIAFSTVRQIANATYTSKWAASQDATYIDGGAIYANSVTANQIAAGAITSGKIAAGAITADKIAAGAITASKVDSTIITTTNLAAQNITASQITSGTINSDRINLTSLMARIAQMDYVGVKALSGDTYVSGEQILARSYLDTNGIRIHSTETGSPGYISINGTSHNSYWISTSGYATWGSFAAAVPYILIGR